MEHFEEVDSDEPFSEKNTPQTQQKKVDKYSFLNGKNYLEGEVIDDYIKLLNK